MKKIVMIVAVAIAGLGGAAAQGLPSITEGVNELKKEAEVVKKDPTTATKVVEAVKTNVTVENTTKLLTLIKTKVAVTPTQETKILGVVSKLEASKTSGSPTDMLKGLLANINFTKIFSSAQLAKLKALVGKK